MNSLWALALLCVSPIETAGNITIVNRLPVVCSDYLGSPPLPVAVAPAASLAEMPYQATEEAAQAVPVKKATKPPKKKAKPAKRSRCKPGRWRNSRGVCGRW